MKCESIVRCESLCLCSRCLMLDIFEVVTGKTCPARPWRSCSRPDGTPLNYYWRANGRDDTRGLSGTRCEVMP